MSTWIYLECRSHTPPLMAEGESGQHLYDLPRIRAEVANRAEHVARWERGEFEDGDDGESYFGRLSARFLATHSECVIGIRDEYGREHPLTEDAEVSS